MAFTANSHPRAAMGMTRVARSSKAIVKAKRVTVKAVKVPAPSRDMQLPMLRRIVEVLRERRERVLETMGNTGRGLLESIISEHIHQFPWLARQMVNHYIATHPGGQPISTVILANSNNQKVMSGLTGALSIT
jgi:hypothetical protein